MSKPSAFPSLVTCLFGFSDGSSQQIVQIQDLRHLHGGVTGGVREAAYNGKRPVAFATSHQPRAKRPGCRRKARAYLSSTLAPASSRAFLAASASSLATPSLDRKSTRLNSSHVKISYAVFCLKKKNTYANII